MTAAFTEQYKTGDRDERPWGSYVVTGVGYNEAGEEFCAKDITVKAGGILSLQSHDLRRETWTVKSGVLTVVLDDKLLTLEVEQSVDIPLGAIHCMANLGATDCVVSEVQKGVCREADIKRYVDANGRKTEPLTSETMKASVEHYNAIAAKISAAAGGG